MAMLGHVSAEMSLRYGRLFDQTVRADYERALTWQVPARAVLPQRTQLPITDIGSGSSDWRDTPTIKSRLAGGGYPARGTKACAYANICEHCPNLRTESTFLPILATQQADAATLAADADARGWVRSSATATSSNVDLLMNRAATP